MTAKCTLWIPTISPSSWRVTGRSRRASSRPDPGDSNDTSFQVAGYWALKEAFLKARPCLLEPIHSLEVRVPADCVGKVIGDLSSRRGRGGGMEGGSHCEV